MSIESRITKGVTRYRGVPQVKGRKGHTAWVKTRAEAAMLEAELKMSMGGHVVRSGHTVGSVVAGYIDDAADRLKPDSTMYYRAGQASIPPVFSDRLVSELNTVLLDSLYRELRKGGASPQTVRRLHSTLSASFSRAVKYGWMASNPCSSATKPSVRAEEIVPPTPEEVKRVIAAAVTVNADLAVCFRLAAATGMRRSELVALQWRDLSGAQIVIRRNRVRDGKQFVTFDTKSGTRSHRTINVDVSTLQALEEVRLRQAAEGRECRWIFTHDGHEPWKPEYLTHSYAGLQREGSSVHGLRHFHATQLLSKGVPVTQVSHRLGHSSPTVTMNTYAHWIPANDQTSADLIGTVLD